MAVLLHEDDCTLNVSSLTRNVQEEHLKEIFGCYGNVSMVHLAMDKTVGLPKGYAYVRFDDRKEAERAKECLSGGQIDGRAIKVDFILVPRQSKANEKLKTHSKITPYAPEGRTTRRIRSNSNPRFSREKGKRSLSLSRSPRRISGYRRPYPVRDRSRFSPKPRSRPVPPSRRSHSPRGRIGAPLRPYRSSGPSRRSPSPVRRRRPEPSRPKRRHSSVSSSSTSSSSSSKASYSRSSSSATASSSNSK